MTGLRALLLALLLSGCATTYAPQRPDPAPRLILPDLLACLDQSRLALVVARAGRAFPHRAGNALSSFQESRNLGITLMSADVSRSRDGELLLLAPEPLEQTTNGRGHVTATDFAALRRLQLKNRNGYMLNENPPTLDEALVWASRHRVVLILEPAMPGLAGAIAEAVHSNGMESRTLIAVDDMANAATARRLAPEILLLARGQSPAAQQLARQGFAGHVLLAQAVQVPTDSQLRGLRDRGSFPLLQTGGHSRFDDAWLADRDGAPFAEQAARGITLFASDRPVQALLALADAGRSGDVCVDGKKSGRK